MFLRTSLTTGVTASTFLRGGPVQSENKALTISANNGLSKCGGAPSPGRAKPWATSQEFCRVLTYTVGPPSMEGRQCHFNVPNGKRTIETTVNHVTQKRVRNGR